MDADKLNKILQKKFDQMNTLPKGVTFQQPALWSKLENNLAKKKDQKLKWLFYAAAIFLPITSSIYLFNSKPANKSVALTDKISVKFAVPYLKNTKVAAEPSTTVSNQVRNTIPNRAITKNKNFPQVVVEKPFNEIQLPEPETSIKDFSTNEDVIPIDFIDLNVNDKPVKKPIKYLTRVKSKFKIEHLNDGDSNALFDNFAVENHKTKSHLININLRIQNKPEEILIPHLSSKNQGGLFKAKLKQPI